MKQSKLRKRRVWRFAVMYFTLFVVFLALAIAPVLGGSHLTSTVESIKNTVGKDTMVGLLFQPNNRSSVWYNDTGPTLTSIKSFEASVLAGKTQSSSGSNAKTTGSSNRRSVKLL
jgi:1,3-beta-glucan synthase